MGYRGMKGRRRAAWRRKIGALCLGAAVGWFANFAHAQESGSAPSSTNEKALAAYADAANFLNGGAYDLAIPQWQNFLREYPDDNLAPFAAHYLGVSLMQREMPNYMGAASAFQKAMEKKDFQLREDALANLGWCLYAAALDEQDATQQKRLYQEALKALAALLKDYPKSSHGTQSLFYAGESAYGLGDLKQAIGHYQQLLRVAPTDSPLRCDALYAQGVAQEELNDVKGALATYQKLLEICQDEGIATEARIRRGDLLLAGEQAEAALAEFSKARATKSELADYAQYRYAAALVKLGRSDEAGAAYSELAKNYPESRYASAAQMAAAQSYYQAGKFPQASPIFQSLLKSGDAAAVIESAHWLAQIDLRAGRHAEAMELAKKTLQSLQEEVPYRDELLLDQAESAAALGKIDDALPLYLQVAERSSDPAVAARALYSAAFAALQAKQSAKAIELANRFLKQFPESSLRADAGYVAAEALVQSGNHAQAVDAYAALLKQVSDHPDRNVWSLRAVTASYLDGRFDRASQEAKSLLPKMKAPREIAEANFLIGASELFANRWKEAIDPLKKAIAADPSWSQVDESYLLLGQAQLKASDAAGAEKTWKELIQKFPKTRMADQARYRLGQHYASLTKYDVAAGYYQDVINSASDPALMPFALYGKGWAMMQAQKYPEAMPALERLQKDYPQHALAQDGKLAYGISLRREGKTAPAKEQLQAYLKSSPRGTELGHALYELSLLELEQKETESGIKHLQQLVAQVPDYPSLDKVLYELAWALKDNGKDEVAVKHFEQLISRFPANAMAAEASYHIGQQRYSAEAWDQAAQAFQKTIDTSQDTELKEKAMYKLGWARFQAEQQDAAEQIFARQVSEFPKGKLLMDARMMIGECRFKRGAFDKALAAYREARTQIEKAPPEKDLDPQEQQVRELVLLHGGQSASQLQQFQDALEWFTMLRQRYPNTRYLAQAFYETGFCYQNLNKPKEALDFYAQVAGNYRTEVAARARFMMGEIHFGQRDPAKAIPEYQRVQLGFGAEQAPPEIKNWQAKAAFEAGRCAELLIQSAAADKRERAVEISREFYQYVIDKHPTHELVSKAQQRLDVLAKL